MRRRLLLATLSVRAALVFVWPFLAAIAVGTIVTTLGIFTFYELNEAEAQRIERDQITELVSAERARRSGSAAATEAAIKEATRRISEQLAAQLDQHDRNNHERVEELKRQLATVHRVSPPPPVPRTPITPSPATSTARRSSTTTVRATTTTRPPATTTTDCDRNPAGNCQGRDRR